MATIANVDEDVASAPRGGYRGTEATAQFTAQLVWLDRPEIKARVNRLARRYRISQAKVCRAAMVDGLAALEMRLADGSITAGSLV